MVKLKVGLSKAGLKRRMIRRWCERNCTGDFAITQPWAEWPRSKNLYDWLPQNWHGPASYGAPETQFCGVTLNEQDATLFVLTFSGDKQEISTVEEFPKKEVANADGI
jgi:hypothetical protein